MLVKIYITLLSSYLGSAFFNIIEDNFLLNDNERIQKLYRGKYGYIINIGLLIGGYIGFNIANILL
jgi:hypothetical protein|tara:strand:- start:803 stop:1000 length:198 start_codon:yes stop_codon:yes gene_type:complete